MGKNDKCFCKTENLFCETEIVCEGTFGWSSFPVTIDKVIYKTQGIFIDKREDKSYLRLVDPEDSSCMDAGQNIEIKFCPFCGDKLNK